jgi:hypothetical protein
MKEALDAALASAHAALDDASSIGTHLDHWPA